jgi:hypothetical protein
MTVSAATPIQNYSYSGPGQYDFDFVVFENDDVTVYHTTVAGVQSELIQDSDYTIQLNADEDGGYIVTTAPTVTSGTLSIRRELAYTQEVDWLTNDPLPAETIEESFDRLVMMIQQIDLQVSEDLVKVNWMGTWTSGIAYSIRDVVVGSDSSIYVCQTAHTSGTFVTDVAAGYWLLVVDVSAAIAAAESALISEANAGTSEDNAANCAAAAYSSASEASISAAAAYASELAADAARDQLMDMLSTNTRTHYTLATSGSVAIDPDNGALQICNMSSAVTLTDSLIDTQVVEVMVKTNGSVLTLPASCNWVNQTYQISTSLWNCYRFWKVGTTLFGAVLNS